MAASALPVARLCSPGQNPNTNPLPHPSTPALTISSAPVEIHSSDFETILVSIPCRIGHERSCVVAKVLLGVLPCSRNLVLNLIPAGDEVVGVLGAVASQTGLSRSQDVGWSSEEIETVAVLLGGLGHGDCLMGDPAESWLCASRSDPENSWSVLSTQTQNLEWTQREPEIVIRTCLETYSGSVWSVETAAWLRLFFISAYCFTRNHQTELLLFIHQVSKRSHLQYSVAFSLVSEFIFMSIIIQFVVLGSIG